MIRNPHLNLSDQKLAYERFLNNDLTNLTVNDRVNYCHQLLWDLSVICNINIIKSPNKNCVDSWVFIKQMLEEKYEAFCAISHENIFRSEMSSIIEELINLRKYITIID